MLTVAPGIAAWGVMTGVAIVKSGIGVGPAVLMATIVFAGSSQLAALPLFAASAPMWLVLATSFCVNLRFVVFSAHLRDYVTHQSLWRRVFNGYLFADLSYVMFTRRFPVPSGEAEGRTAQDAYWAGSGWTGWTIWTVSGLLGIALGSSVPESWGLEFAGLLALAGITCSLVSSRPRMLAATVAAVVAVATFALPMRLNIVVAIAAAVAVCALSETRLKARRD
jgi:predicted branched-subunit amino acid permease